MKETQFVPPLIINIRLCSGCIGLSLDQRGYFGKKIQNFVEGTLHFGSISLEWAQSYNKKFYSQKNNVFSGDGNRWGDGSSAVMVRSWQDDINIYHYTCIGVNTLTLILCDVYNRCRNIVVKTDAQGKVVSSVTGDCYLWRNGSDPIVRMQNFRKKLCGIKTNPYICNALHNDQRGNSLTAGIFYTHFYRFHTPLQNVNASAAGHSVRQRVGVKPFYLHIV